jgi:hypothetical protein
MMIDEHVGRIVMSRTFAPHFIMEGKMRLTIKARANVRPPWLRLER